jgi:hypothetical protein
MCEQILGAIYILNTAYAYVTFHVQQALRFRVQIKDIMGV